MAANPHPPQAPAGAAPSPTPAPASDERIPAADDMAAALRARMAQDGDGPERDDAGADPPGAPGEPVARAQEPEGQQPEPPKAEEPKPDESPADDLPRRASPLRAQLEEVTGKLGLTEQQVKDLNERIEAEAAQRAEAQRQADERQRVIDAERAEYQRRQQQLRERVGQTVGAPEETAYLLWALDNNKIPEWDTETRERAEQVRRLAEYAEYADLQIREGWAAGYRAVAEKPGIDVQRLVGLGGADVLPHVYDAAFAAGKQAVRDEATAALKAKDERISQLEAELKGAQQRAVGALRSPEFGGASTNGPGAGMPGPDAPAGEQIAAGLKLRLNAGPRNGR